MKLDNLNNKITKHKKYIIIFLPLLIILTIIVFNDFFIYLKNFLPSCIFRKLTNYYCPGCGNTRSVVSLLHGDILSSLRYNICPIFLLILLALLYIEQVALQYNKKIKLIPRSVIFWVITTILLISYYILRNFIPYFTPK